MRWRVIIQRAMQRCDTIARRRHQQAARCTQRSQLRACRAHQFGGHGRQFWCRRPISLRRRAVLYRRIMFPGNSKRYNSILPMPQCSRQTPRAVGKQWHLLEMSSAQPVSGMDNEAFAAAATQVTSRRLSSVHGHHGVPARPLGRQNTRA